MSVITAKDKNERDNDSDSRGKVFVVGIGPGDINHLTASARNAIAKSSVILGYKRYVNLISPLITHQRLCVSGMTEELTRCKHAIDLAKAGAIVSLVSSGDPGIYGMAGLVLELNEKHRVDIEIVPGVSAVNAAASLVGAPLMNDFAVISLSDLLTPWEVIEKRIRCTAEGDFVIAIYNPKSKKRIEHIVRAKEIIRRYRSGNTPVAIVTNAFREGESIVTTDLENLTKEKIGMLSIVIIGNSQTVCLGGKLITSRGYQTKYADSF
ncbi:MAG: precorrin-3B C(17)-methyltransferase [Nitrospirae bacterium]|nr:precorrin-3B C(17)-methyltransferase [Nitrospirota bacterium]